MLILPGVNWEYDFGVDGTYQGTRPSQILGLALAWQQLWLEAIEFKI